MSATTTTVSPTKVITPFGMLSYPHFFVPQKADDATKKDKYSGTLVLFPAGADLSRFEDPAIVAALQNADLTPLKAAMLAAAKAKWGDKAEGMIRNGQLKNPFRKEGDAYGTVMKEKGYPDGCVFINCRSNNGPQVVDRTNQPVPATEADKIYPGLIGRMSINAFAYDTSGNKGVAFALNNFQKWLDGPRLDGRVAAKDEFEADLTAAPAALDDLFGV